MEGVCVCEWARGVHARVESKAGGVVRVLQILRTDAAERNADQSIGCSVKRLGKQYPGQGENPLVVSGRSALSHVRPCDHSETRILEVEWFIEKVKNERQQWKHLPG